MVTPFIAQPQPIKMTRRERYGSFGRCIYCAAENVPLTDEHIIPESIGGDLIIEKASCNECQGQMHAFEGHACNTYRAIRRQLNFPSKTKGKKAALRYRSERFILDVDGRRVKVSADEFPALLISLAFPMPTALFDLPPDDLPLSGGIHSVEVMPQFGERLNEIKRKYRANSVSIVGVDNQHRKDAGDFGRMLAKIGHSYAVAELGPHGFKPVLTNIIRGQRPFFLTHYIGSQVTTTEQGTDLHEVSFDKMGLDGGLFVIVRVRLFATYNTPAHLIVVGTRQA
jgi:HNH endonuclease